MRKTLAIAACTIAILAPSQSDSGEDYGRMARSTWSAFKCSAWADLSKNVTEQQRLFQYGLNQGRSFLDALQNNPTQFDQFRKAAPIGVVMLLGGPSADFILGRIFESAVEDALTEFYPSDGSIPDDELQGIMAQSKFDDANCALLGTQFD